MTLATHGDQKYQNSEKLAEAADWPALSIEHRRFEAGRQATPVPICTEIVMLLSGGGMVCRAGNGEVQKSLARPGMSYLVPVGTQENHLELSDRMECLHLYLPPVLLDHSALADFDVDPAKVQIAYAHGLTDQVLFHICSPLRDLLHRPRQPTDALFVEGIQIALAAHLLGTIRLTAGARPKSHRRSIREGSSVCWTISRLLSKPTSGSRNWRPRPASARFISPDFFAKRPDCRRTAM